MQVASRVGAADDAAGRGIGRRELEEWCAAVERLAHAVVAERSESVDPGASARDALALISELESLRNAAAAAQAALAVRVDRCRRAEEALAGVPARRRRRGVPAELALARRVGISAGRRLLGLGGALTREMPFTFASLAAGDLTEWRATLLARETACLTLEDRVAVDAELCADPRTLEGKGDRAVVATAKQAAYRRDAESVVRRGEVAESERRVWLRPAPDQMTYLTALLPLTQGVATYAALRRTADAARVTGEAGGRGRGQLMADALVTRVTGLDDPEQVPVRVNLLMTDAALFHGDGEPGVVPGYGPVPAAWVREQVGRRGAAGWLRRLYVAPRSGDLVAMDARSRAIPRGLADFIRLRDQDTCRMPWCDAPLRHEDHVVPVADGGATSADNLQGLCEAHNYAKEAPGWVLTPTGDRRLQAVPGVAAQRRRRSPRPRPRPRRMGRRESVGAQADDAVRIRIRTPAGDRYESRPPAPPRRRGGPHARSRHGPSDRAGPAP